MTQPQSSSPAKLLVIDDDADFRVLLSAFARSLGYQADSAADWDEADAKLQAAQTAAEPFSVVTVDMSFEFGAKKVPLRLGVDILKTLRRNYPSIICVMVSGSTIEPEDMVELAKDPEIDLGSFLRKENLNREKLEEAIERARRRAKKRETMVHNAVVIDDTSTQKPSGLVPNPPGKAQVFLSYSHKDRLFMRRLRDALRTAGIVVWSDEALIPGTEDWQRAIEQAIEEVEAVLIILTEDSAKSDYVSDELNYARMFGKAFFPVLAAGDTEHLITHSLTLTQWIDMRDDDRYEANIAPLIEALQRHIRTPHIFISFDEADTTFAEKLLEDLRERGFKAFTAQNIAYRAINQERALNEAIGNAGAMVVVLSPGAKSSAEVRRDSTYARERGIKVVPVLCDGDHINSIPLGVARLGLIDMRDRSVYPKILSELVHQLRDRLL